MTQRARLAPFVMFLVLGATGCTMRPSEQCEAAWQSSPDEGSACESSAAALDATGDPTATDTAQTADATAPRDVSTGLATGRRQHKPF